MAIKQYSLKNDGAKQLSPAFRVREFRCRDGTDTILIDEGLAEDVSQKRFKALSAGQLKVHGSQTRSMCSSWQAIR